MAGQEDKKTTETPAVEKPQAENPFQSVVSRLMEQDGYTMEPPADAGEVAEESPTTEETPAPESQEEAAKPQSDPDPVAEDEAEWDIEDFLAPPKESDSDDSDGQWPEGTPDWVPARVGREKEKAAKWRVKAEELERRVEEAQQEAEYYRNQYQTGGKGFEDLSEESLSKQEESARSLLKRARKWDRLLARGDSERVSKEIEDSLDRQVDDPDDFVENLIERAESVLESIPSKRKVIESAKAVEAQASQTFAWMKDPESPVRKQYDYMLSQRPELKRIPEHPMLLGMALLGSQVMAQHAKKGQRSAPQAPKRTPPKSPTGTSSAPSPKPAGDVENEELTRKARSGDQNAMKDFLGAYTMSRMPKQ